MQIIEINHITVATPDISASNGDTDYEISGPPVTLSCISSSDSSGTGTYVWKLATEAVYVLSRSNALIYHFVDDITANCYRDGAISQTYTVPNTDNTAAGDYTCMVTVHTVTSSESSSYSITATGSLKFKA